MKNFNVRIMVEAGVMIALALVLDNIKIFTMPQGGSITLGSMIPIMIFSFRWGGLNGIKAGIAFGILQFLLGGKSLHPASIILDYVLAWGMVGCAGFFSGNIKKIILGIIIGIFGRFLCSYASGVLIYYMYAPEGMSPYLYSLIYNGSYLGVEAIIAVAVISMLYKYLKPYLEVQTLK